MKIEKMLVEFANEQMMISDINYDFVSFEFDKTNSDIVNPYYDENGMNEVNPEEYYGKTNFEEWKKQAIARINEK